MPSTRKDRIDLGRFIKEHQGGVWRYLRYHGCSPEEADDYTQAAFLAVLKDPSVLDRVRSAPAYVCQVARNLFFKSHRRSLRTVSFSKLENTEGMWEEFGEENAWHGYLEAMNSCLENLEGKSREILDLRFKQKKSRDEIARMYALSIAGVKSILFRVKKALRKCIEKRLGK